MDPKVSIVVPVYKVEPYLHKCIDSLIAQTYKNLEIILVDDGSPDNCPRICDEYANNIENITVFHKKNSGLSSARNFGVSKCNGEYVTFVDSDDFVESSYVNDMVELLNSFDADLAVTRVRRQNINGESTDNYKKFKSYCVNGSEAFFQIYSGKNIGWQAYGKLFKKDILVEYPFPDGYFEDFAIMYKILLSCDKVAIGDYRNNYHYIQREGSILISQISDKHLRIFDLCKEIELFIKNNYNKKRKFKHLTVIIYKRSVMQLLNLIKMSNDDFKSIYYKYRKFFRKNCFGLFFSPHFTLAQKEGVILLCLNDKLYKKILKLG